MASALVHEFSDTNFKSEVLDAAQPVLVDFWAEWCMPCRMLAPTIEQIAGEFEGKAKVGKLDTDKNRDVSVEYRITAIPTVMVFKGGELKKKFVGLTNAGELRKALSELV
ncbi:MAG TPA: thioredoxin [Phycisphaerales bacterium]|nr:thioredoxin [Phycisphaerales bacterium]